MKIYRGPRSGGFWNITDSKKPSEYIDTWAPGEKIVFNGTIDKDGQRHTELGLEIEEGDVVALFNTLLKRHREKQNELICSLRDSQGEMEVLRDAQTKIHDLISYHSEDAPSKNALIQAVQTIAEHYRLPFNKDEKPKIDWIKWDSI